MTRRVLSRLSIATLVALMALGALASFHIPAAHAATTPTIVQEITVDNMNNTTGTTSATFPSDITYGDELVAFLGVAGGNAWESSVSDSLSGGWESRLSNSAWSSIYPQTPYLVDGINDSIQIFFGWDTTAATNPDTISVSLSELNCPCGSSYLQTVLTIFEISGQTDNGAIGVPITSFNTGVENGTGGTTHTAGTNSLGNADSDLDLGMYVDGGADKIVTAASPESMITTNSPTVNMGYAIASAATSSTVHYEFDTSGTAAYSVIYAVSIGAV